MSTIRHLLLVAFRPMKHGVSRFARNWYGYVRGALALRTREASGGRWSRRQAAFNWLC